MISWYAERVDDWAASAAVLGLDPALVASLAGLISAAQNAEAAAFTARIASKDATVLYHNEANALRDFGAGIVKTIKATAETSDDPNIYSIASIPPPAPPTPLGPPEQPTDLAAAFALPYGVRLSWKGSVSQGAYFGVWRKLPGESDFVLLKTTSEKFYEDANLPQTAGGVSYYISANRDEYKVSSLTLSLQFGPGGAQSLSIAA